MRSGQRSLVARASLALAVAASTGFEALMRHRLRSVLTTAGLTAGVGALVAVYAVIEALSGSFHAALSGLGASALYVERTPWLSDASDQGRSMLPAPITMKEVRAVERGAVYAAAVAPLATASVAVSVPGTEQSWRVILRGTTERFLEVGGGEVGAGRFISEADVLLGRPVVVLGAELAEHLFPRAPADAVVGSRVRVSGKPYEVIGVLARAGRLFGHSLDHHATVPLSSFQRVFGRSQSLVIAVAGVPGNEERLVDEVVEILRFVRGVRPGADNDFAINRGEQLLQLYRSLTGGLFGVCVAIGVLTLVLGGVGIMNVMMTSVGERTREIGVRRALGASRRAIALQFVLEAVALSLVGGVLGSLLGAIAAACVAAAFSLPIDPSGKAVVVGVSFASLVGVVFGAWPASLAARLQPADALRAE